MRGRICPQCGSLSQSLSRTASRNASRRGYATTAAPSSSKPRTALFFPGHGVQRIGMCGPWLEAFPQTARPAMQEVDEILQIPLLNIIENGQNSVLNETVNSQPAIMATSIMILRVMEKEFGFDLVGRVDFTLGHSLGEFAALVAGGYMSMNDAVRLVRMRAEVMSRCSREAKALEGDVGMIALVCEPDRLADMVDAIHDFLGMGSQGSKSDHSEDVPPVQQVLIANANSKNQVVLSGPIHRIKTLLTHIREFGGHDPRAVLLNSESPFHSPIMQPAADAIKRMLSSDKGRNMVTFPGIVPCVSNVTARPFHSKEELEDLLSRQAVQTVMWWDSIKYLDRDEKVRRWIGIGPGKVGRNLVGKEVGMTGTVKGGGVWGISTPKEVEETIRGLDDTDFAGEQD